jgi:hypothetical protein
MDPAVPEWLMTEFRYLLCSAIARERHVAISEAVVTGGLGWALWESLVSSWTPWVFGAGGRMGE